MIVLASTCSLSSVNFAFTLTVSNSNHYIFLFNSFFHQCTVSFFVLGSFGLKSLLSDLGVVTPDYFQVHSVRVTLSTVFSLNTFHCLFSPCVSWRMRWVSWRQWEIRFCFWSNLLVWLCWLGSSELFHWMPQLKGVCYKRINVSADLFVFSFCSTTFLVSCFLSFEFLSDVGLFLFV